MSVITKNVEQLCHNPRIEWYGWYTLYLSEHSAKTCTMRKFILILNLMPGAYFQQLEKEPFILVKD